MALDVLTPAEKTNALRGGSITVREKPLLPFGSFSMVQNFRGRHPGFTKRLGQKTLHTTADGTNEVLNIFQWSKSRISEDHLLVQMGDGDLLEATNGAPIVTTGVFGSTVHSGSDNQIPGCFSDIGDKLVYSNGIDQHQIFGGSGSYISSFIVYKGTGTIPNIPIEGLEYTVEVSDGRTTTSADVGSLSTLAAYDCLFIRTPVQIKSLTFTLENTNSSAAVAQGHYWNGSTWTSLSDFTDGTTYSGMSLYQTGTMAWTAPTDIKPKYAFGANDWWYRISLSSGALDSSVSITGITFDSDMHSIINMWDGTPQDAVEARVYDDSDGVYRLYGSTAIDVGEITTSDVIYFACTDPIQGIYIDPGSVPSATAGAITDMYYWDGHAWRGIVTTDSGTLNDGSAGITQPGWVTFSRPTVTPQPRQFQGSTYYAYWYYFKVGATLEADTNIGIQYMPYFDITDLGYSQCNVVWKDRIVYAFDRWSEYIYFSTTNAPMVFNGFDYGILEVGDGRSNKVVAMRRFHNELMVWQEEKGEAGGCITLIEGYTPTTFGKLLLSTKIGTMSNKTVCIVDGVLTATASEERVKTLAFFISRYGICACDGRTVNIISDAIQNYFNPNEPECIRRGYEQKMWLNHDSSESVLRMGIVSGSSATECNVFPVYDLIDKVWYFDTPAQELSCMSEVAAVSGAVTVLQLGGGVDDGFVYQLNTGQNDGAYAIESFAQMELGGMGGLVLLKDFILRAKSEEAGEIYLEFFVDGISKYRQNIALIPDNYGSFVKRLRKSLGLEGGHISIKIGNYAVNQDLYLEDLGLQTLVWKNA